MQSSFFSTFHTATITAKNRISRLAVSNLELLNSLITNSIDCLQELNQTENANALANIRHSLFTIGVSEIVEAVNNKMGHVFFILQDLENLISIIFERHRKVIRESASYGDIIHAEYIKHQDGKDEINFMTAGRTYSFRSVNYYVLFRYLVMYAGRKSVSEDDVLDWGFKQGYLKGSREHPPNLRKTLYDLDKKTGIRDYLITSNSTKNGQWMLK